MAMKRSDFCVDSVCGAGPEKFIRTNARGCREYLHKDGELCATIKWNLIYFPNCEAAEKALVLWLAKNGPSGAELIAAERARHAGLGFTAEHDDGQTGGGCNCNTIATEARYKLLPGMFNEDRFNGYDDRIEELAQAGSLCAAEIDRLNRRKIKAAEDEARKLAERPRPFKYADGVGVFNPKTGAYNYVSDEGRHGSTPYQWALSGFAFCESQAA